MKRGRLGDEEGVKRRGENIGWEEGRGLGGALPSQKHRLSSASATTCERVDRPQKFCASSDQEGPHGPLPFAFNTWLRQEPTTTWTRDHADPPAGYPLLGLGPHMQFCERRSRSRHCLLARKKHPGHPGISGHRTSTIDYREIACAMLCLK